MDVFRLPVPEWTDDFVIALKSIGMHISPLYAVEWEVCHIGCKITCLCSFIDPYQMHNSWKLSEGFVAEEARSLLPYRANAR